MEFGLDPAGDKQPLKDPGGVRWINFHFLRACRRDVDIRAWEDRRRRKQGGIRGGAGAEQQPPPPDVLLRIPRTCAYVTLYDERDFAVIKLRAFRWKDYPGLTRQAQCNHRNPYKWRTLPSQRETGLQKNTQHCVCCVSDTQHWWPWKCRKRLKPRHAGGLQELEKARKWALPYSLQTEAWFQPGTPIWLDLYNCETVHFCVLGLVAFSLFLAGVWGQLYIGLVVPLFPDQGSNFWPCNGSMES